MGTPRIAMKFDRNLKREGTFDVLGLNAADVA
jgi:hypothetical protein